MGLPVSEKGLMPSLRDDLIAKVKVLNETIWEQQAEGPAIIAWLDNFSDSAGGLAEEQQLHALYLLSRFMYFGRREMRELLRALFRDQYKYPVVEALRRANADTTDFSFLESAFKAELQRTRFLGVGNPSESGTHLLYYFRQENGLTSELFINTHEIFTRTTGGVAFRESTVSRYVFIDDFCGTGTQATRYSRAIVEEIKALNRAVEVSYYALFATVSGLETVRDRTRFDRVDSVFELDESYKCFGPDSRYFRNPPNGLAKDVAEKIGRMYGSVLLPAHPLGFNDGQLLVGFYHNTPDNTLPIIWYAGPNAPWVPIFRRYPKLYNWGGI
jgi:hypothetical protein